MNSALTRVKRKGMNQSCFWRVTGTCLFFMRYLAGKAIALYIISNFCFLHVYTNILYSLHTSSWQQPLHLPFLENITHQIRFINPSFINHSQTCVKIFEQGTWLSCLVTYTKFKFKAFFASKGSQVWQGSGFALTMYKLLSLRHEGCFEEAK